MKKTILILAASALLTGAILTSCSSPAEKVEKAEQKVTEANNNLESANKEYLAEIDAYRV